MEDSDNTVRSGIKLEDSAIWKKLYDFQRDAVVGAIHKLEKYKGCIIADSVGLGKTFEALAIIKYYQERNEKPKAEPAVKLQCDREKNSRPIALVSTSLR